MSAGVTRRSTQRAFAGFRVGVVTPPVSYPLIPGNAANAESYTVPVLFEALPVKVEDIMSGDVAVGAAVSKAVQNLEAAGVQAIVGTCGSLINYQDIARDAVAVPVFMSVMAQVPLLLAGLGSRSKLGLIMASRASLTERVLKQARIGNRNQLVVGEVCDLPQFSRLIAGRAFDAEAMRTEVVDRAVELCRENEAITAIVLQCSDLPPFAHDIARATGRPVFSTIELVEWLARAARPTQHCCTGARPQGII